MRVDYLDGQFVVSCSFEERTIARDAGFQWHPQIMRWVTDRPQVALKLEKYLEAKALRFCVAPDKLISPDAINPTTGEPYAYLDFQEGGIRFAMPRKDTLIADEPGLGKGHPISTHIATPTGFRPLGELNVGDFVMGSNGTPICINAIYNRGVLPVFTVSFDDGAQVTCDAEHLWLVYDEIAHDWTTYTTLHLAGFCMAGVHPAIPTLGAPIQFIEQDYPVEPRVAGLDLANRRTFNQILDIDVRKYQFGSVAQRSAFLTSVIRTLGRVRNGKIKIDIKAPEFNAELIETIVQITRSLGGIAYVERRGARKTRIMLHLPEDVYLPLIGYSKPGKLMNARWKNFVPGVPPRRVLSVRPAGSDEVRCLSVDAPDKLYITEDYLVTHNTIQAIGVGNQLPDLRSMLIICFASLKENWRREFERWDVHGLSVDVAFGDTLPDTECVIINYDILDRHYDKLRAGKWGLLVADEAHALQTPNTKRTANVLGGTQMIQDPDKPNAKRKKKIRLFEIEAQKRVFLTGTPMPTRPKNIWPITHACDPDGIGADYKKFAYRYCGAYEDTYGFEDNGSSNLDELHDMLHSRFMIRRLKDDVLKDLPPKTRQVIPLESESLDRKLSAEKDAIMELLRQYEVRQGIHKENPTMDDIAEAILSAPPQMFDDYADKATDTIEPGTPLGQLAIARQELAIAKIPLIKEHVQNLLLSERKVIVFAYHRAVILALREAFKDYNPAVIFGDTPQQAKRDVTKTRQGQADKFQTDDSCRVFIGQYTAAGTGWTLTAARVVVCAELTWVPYEITQAEDRAHRISQLYNVLVHHLVVKGSLDDAMIYRLMLRQKVISQALDGGGLNPIGVMPPIS